MGKHSIKKSKTKTNKGIILVIIIAILIIIFGIIRLIENSVNEKSKFIEQEEIINNAFSALKNPNKKEIENYLDYATLISGLDESILQENVSLENYLFNSMEWSIENIKEENENIVVVVEVSNKDYRKIITEWLKEIVEVNEENNSISEVESLQILERILQEDNCGTRTVIKKIQLSQQNGNWRIIVNDDLINLLYPGIETVNSVF